jgi:hypothetical protein
MRTYQFINSVQIVEIRLFGSKEYSPICYHPKHHLFGISFLPVIGGYYHDVFTSQNIPESEIKDYIDEDLYIHPDTKYVMEYPSVEIHLSNDDVITRHFKTYEKADKFTHALINESGARFYKL